MILRIHFNLGEHLLLFGLTNFKDDTNTSTSFTMMQKKCLQVNHSNTYRCVLNKINKVYIELIQRLNPGDLYLRELDSLKLIHKLEVLLQQPR